MKKKERLNETLRNKTTNKTTECMRKSECTQIYFEKKSKNKKQKMKYRIEEWAESLGKRNLH